MCFYLVVLALRCSKPRLLVTRMFIPECPQTCIHEKSQAVTLAWLVVVMKSQINYYTYNVCVNKQACNRYTCKQEEILQYVCIRNTWQIYWLFTWLAWYQICKNFSSILGHRKRIRPNVKIYRPFHVHTGQGSSMSWTWTTTMALKTALVSEAPISMSQRDMTRDMTKYTYIHVKMPLNSMSGECFKPNTSTIIFTTTKKRRNTMYI